VFAGLADGEIALGFGGPSAQRKSPPICYAQTSGLQLILRGLGLASPVPWGDVQLLRRASEFTNLMVHLFSHAK
jgi:hypothetical protein